MSWGSFTKSISKPFKQVGKAIHWTDIRTPVMAAAATAAAVYTGGATLAYLAGTETAASVAASGSLGASLVSGMSTAGAAMTTGAAMGYGALAGGYMGYTSQQQSKALAAQQASDAATIAAADKIAAASAGTATVTPAATSQVDYATSASNEATAAKRRYSVSRTVNGSSLLGGFGASTRRSTLG